MNLWDNNSVKEFRWINQPKDWEISDGKLTVTAPKASDFFIDEEGPSIRKSAPIYYTVAEGDFELTTRVSIDMNYEYDSGCIMIMNDDYHWAKLCYENWMNEPAIVSVVTKETSDDCPSYKIGRVKPYLKVLRSDNNFGFHYSLDGENWTIVRYFNIKAHKKIKIGVAAQCPVGDECTMSFEFLDLQQKKIKSAKTVE